MVIGMLLLGTLLAIAFLGPLVVDVTEAAPMSIRPDQAPNANAWLGSDSQGRSLAALLVKGIPLTLQIGFLAGGIGLVIGTILGLVSGYAGGVTDLIIRSAADIMLTVPGLLVLIVIASSIDGFVEMKVIAGVVALLAWMWPTRTIRSQVLTLRSRPYVEMAKLNGMGTMQIIWRELIPNLLPFLGASFVGAVGSAVLATIGIEALGTRSAGFPYPWNDDLLVDLLLVTVAGSLVVVGGANCCDRHAVCQPLPDRIGAG